MVNGTTRAVIYARISQDPTGNSEAPDRQLADCRLACARRGWEVVDEIVDRDLSAWNTRTRRPGFESLMAGIREHRFDAVVVYNIDRLVRNVFSGWTTLMELTQLDIKLVSYSQEIDTSSPQGKATFTQWLAFAEEESRTKSRRIKRALGDKAQQGDAHGGGGRLYGYRKVGKSLEQVPEEVAILREVRERLLGGTSMRAMATELNTRGIRTTTGKAWSGTQLTQVLDSPSLAGLRGHRVPRTDEKENELKDGRGEVIYDRELHSARWKENAVFTADEWQELLAVIHGRSRRYHGGGVAVQPHLLSGLIRCGECGQRLSYRTSKYRRSDGLVTFGSYSCVKGPGVSGCGKLGITSAALEQYVVKHVLDFVSNARLRPTVYDELLLDELSKSQDRDLESRKLIDRERFVLGTRSEDSYRPIYEELSERIDAQRIQISALISRREEREKALMPGDRDELQRYWDGLGINERRAALRNILQSINILRAPVNGGNVFRGDERVRLNFNWTAYMAAADQFESTATTEELIAADEEYRRLNEESLNQDNLQSHV